MGKYPQTKIPDDPVPANKVRETMDDLARRFGGALRRFFQRRVRQTSDIDDLVQEVFLRLVKYGGIDHIENVDRYVFSTASNLLRDRWRDRSVKGAGLHEGLPEDFQDESAFSPERVIEAKEKLARLMLLIGQLPVKTQAAFVLCEIHGYSHADAAEDLGMSPRNLRKHLRKAFDHIDAARRNEW